MLVNIISKKFSTKTLTVLLGTFILSACSDPRKDSAHDPAIVKLPAELALESISAEIQNEYPDLNVSQRFDNAENPEKSIVVVEASGLQDDSISVERTKFWLEYEDGQWTIVDTSKKQKCFPGRGHQYFSAEPCK